MAKEVLWIARWSGASDCHCSRGVGVPPKSPEHFARREEGTQRESTRERGSRLTIAVVERSVDASAASSHPRTKSDLSTHTCTPSSKSSERGVVRCDAMRLRLVQRERLLVLIGIRERHRTVWPFGIMSTMLASENLTRIAFGKESVQRRRRQRSFTLSALALRGSAVNQ
jgi:hypothetical protein